VQGKRGHQEVEALVVSQLLLVLEEEEEEEEEVLCWKEITITSEFERRQRKSLDAAGRKEVRRSCKQVDRGARVWRWIKRWWKQRDQRRATPITRKGPIVGKEHRERERERLSLLSAYISPRFLWELIDWLGRREIERKKIRGGVSVRTT
jgi:hypothetical protein